MLGKRIFDLSHIEKNWCDQTRHLSAFSKKGAKKGFFWGWDSHRSDSFRSTPDELIQTIKLLWARKSGHSPYLVT